MGLTDKLKDLTDKAKDAAAGHKDQVHQAVQKAAALADQRTGGQYHDQLAKAGTKADAYVDDLKATEPRHPEAPTPDTPHPPPTPAE